MRWTVWWSFALVGLGAAGCGNGGGQSESASDNSNAPEVREVVATASDCAQLDDFFSELLALTNKARQDAGIGTLSFSYQLGQAAQGYAEDLATENFFSHTGKDGSTLTSRLTATGYDFLAAGENLAAGQQTAEGVFQGWMNSPGHRANILQAEYTEVGFGMFDTTGSSDYGRYWVQNFGKPQGDRAQSESAYIPDSCGLSVADAESVNSANNGSVVAGIAVGALVSQTEGETGLPGAFDVVVPVEVLAGGVAAANVTGQAESVPEPAMLLGLGALGLMLWRDRAGH